MKLSAKLILFLGIIGLPVASVATTVVFFYVTAEDALLRLANRAMSFAAADTGDHLQEFFKPARDAAILTELLSQHEVIQAGDPLALERHFYRVLRLTPWLDGVNYGAKDGHFVYVGVDDLYTDGGYLTKIVGIDGGLHQVDLTLRTPDFEKIAREVILEDSVDPRARPSFADALASDGLSWTKPYILFNSGHPNISVAFAVRDKTGRVTGVVGVDIVMAGLTGFLSALDIGQSGAAFIFDRAGDIIAFPDVSTLARTSDTKADGLRFVSIEELDVPAAKAAILSLGGELPDLRFTGEVFSRFVADDGAFVSIAVPFPSDEWQWVLGLYFPEDVVLGEIKQSRLVAVLLAIAIGLVACIVGFLIWRGIARFLDALRHGALAVEAGRLEDGWTFKSPFRELADTGAVFGAMIDRLRRRDQENSALTLGLRNEIAAHEQTDTELKKSEERYALALAGTNDGIWDWDLAAGRIQVSPRLPRSLASTRMSRT